MGLDMELRVRAYVSGWECDNVEENEKYREILDIVGFTRCKENPSLYVENCVIHWRKANQIHKWFLDLADGVDVCQPIYVSVNQLQELHKLCVESLELKTSDLLPPCSGFFFGSIEIDEWYWDNLRRTADLLGELLKNDNLTQHEFVYQASW